GDWIMTNTVQIASPQAHEIAGYWDWDKIHAPKPLTPLAGDAVVNTMRASFTIAQHGFGSMRPCAPEWLTTICTRRSYPMRAALHPRETATNSRQLDGFAFKIGERWAREWKPALIPMLQKRVPPTTTPCQTRSSRS